MGQIAQLAGTGLQAKGQLMQGAAEAQAANFNAFLEEQSGLQKSALIRKQGRRHKGKQRTAIAKAGVTLSGSALDAIAETAAQTEVDAINTRREAFLNATMLRQQAKYAKKGAKLAAGATLLSGVGQVASSFTSFGGTGGA